MLPTPITDQLNIDQVYEPAEDSFLLLDTLESEQDYLQNLFGNSPTPIVLELGIGSGIVTTFLHRHILPNALFIGTDVNPYACEAALQVSRNNGGTRYFEVLRSNLWDGIRPRSVDLLVFNPPYVPDETVPKLEDSVNNDDWLDFALLGGEDGMKVTNMVLDQLDRILTKDRGIAYILFCRRNKPHEVAQRMRTLGWAVDLVGERKAGWELLDIMRFTRA